MGNNVLPARAGEALKVVLLSARCDASKRTLLGSVVAERILDLLALATIFVVVVYGALSSSVLPTDRPLLVAGLGRGPARARRASRSGSCAATTSSSARATGCARSPTRRARCSAARARCCWPARSCCGRSRRPSTWPWRARSIWTSASPARSTWWRSPTSSRRCPPLPARSGPSTPRWRSARAGSGRAARWRSPTCCCCASCCTSRSRSSASSILVTRYGGWSRLRAALRLEAEAEADGHPRLARADAGGRRTAPHPRPARARRSQPLRRARRGRAGWAGRTAPRWPRSSRAAWRSSAVTLLLPVDAHLRPVGLDPVGPRDPPVRPGDRGRPVVEAVPDLLHGAVLAARPGRRALPVAVGRARGRPVRAA